MSFLMTRLLAEVGRPQKATPSVRSERVAIPGHMGKVARFRLLRCTESAAMSRDAWARIEAIRARRRLRKAA